MNNPSTTWKYKTKQSKSNLYPNFEKFGKKFMVVLYSGILYSHSKWYYKKILNGMENVDFIINKKVIQYKSSNVF